jgi:uncharacterized surface protein with fasciclin (FAS1) repeats
MVQRQIAKQRRHWIIAACGLLIGTSVFQGCKDDDVLTGQPSWLGNSIYERLEEDGHYTTMLKLIDDLGQKEVLSHTGSKTLFAANDSAFQQWYAKNNWGVSSYGQLSLSQKKLLLNNSMINNAYLIELMSNANGNPPLEGKCMRRETATSVFDSVEWMRPEAMPNTAAWAKLKERGRAIAIVKDATEAPMIHFLPAFMKLNKMKMEDLEILTNHEAKSLEEAWVNGKRVTERDITCKNGYIQKMSGVTESSPNMAEIVHQHPSVSKWAGMLDRFSAPYLNIAGTREYNRLYGTEDSLYTLRYFSEISAGGQPNTTTPNGEAVGATLKFDPGWNQYITKGNDMGQDAGAMFAPTNAALEAWWNGEGKDLKAEYQEIDSLPEATVAALINVNLRPTMTETVPSKFDRVLNDAMETMGITTADVDSCFMGCNGVVYLTNKVFPPAEFSSVAFPALAHPSTMNIIYWAIDQLYFRPYLLSMDSKYSVILPTNEAMMWYIDPASYGNESDGQEAATVLQFYYDEKKAISQRVQAVRYNCTVDQDGRITLGDVAQQTVTTSVIRDNLKRLMDQLIIVGDVEDGHEYYKSKGGTLMRVVKNGDQIGFAGAWQTEHNGMTLKMDRNDIFEKKNGKAYVLNGMMPLATGKSVYRTLQEEKDAGRDSLFLQLLYDDGADLLIPQLKIGSKQWRAGKLAENNLKLLDNYNYTIYVPTDAAIKELTDQGLLPTWEDYEAQTEEIWGSEEAAELAKEAIKDIIVGFLRYHVQDHSIAINMAPELYDEEYEYINGVKTVTKKTPIYENRYESMLRNPENGQFYSLTVNNENGQMWVKDALGRTRHVVKSNGLYNKICREYWFAGITDANSNNATTYMASDAVVHQIDGVLLAKEMKPWKEVVEKAVKARIRN